MSTRSERLLALIQALRRRRRAVSAADLASELGVSERTVYRDIDTLRGSGIDIGAAAGVGFALRDHAFLAPLTFSRTEVDALALGLHFVQTRGDAAMRAAAADALAKIRVVVGPDKARGFELPSFIAAARTPSAQDEVLEAIRAAMLGEHKLLIGYRNLAGQESERIVWPILVGFMEQTELLAAWCEFRQAVRHFRLDRISSAQQLAQPYGIARADLLAQWQREQIEAGAGVPGQ